jgi:ABC-2 type transport system ATP-binding protein
VKLFGKSPAEAVAAGAVGGMLQTGALVEYLSVRELITMVASVYPRPLPVEHAMRLAGVTEFAERRTNKLSGGQTQRVRFAIALVANTDLLMLDEPTAAVDVEGRREFWASIRTVASGSDRGRDRRQALPVRRHGPQLPVHRDRQGRCPQPHRGRPPGR